MFIITVYLRLYLTLALSCATQASFAPAAIPIAARSPYLLTFLPTQPSVQYSRTWQTGYSTQAQAWVGLIRVDNVTYQWAGGIGGTPKGIQDPQPTGPVQTLTPTSSVFFYQVGPVQLTVTFLSPIEPGDLVKQSIPASYVALALQATDGASHSIQVYTDITAEWVSGDRTQSVTWSTNTTDPAIIYHSVSAVNQLPYQEVGAQAAWGSICYAAPRTPTTTFRTGGYAATRGQFVQTGTLDNTQDTAFRGISDDYPVFAFAQDLGNIQQTTMPLIWAVANIRDSESNGVVTYTDLSQQLRTRSLYYRSRYTDDGALLSDFLADFPAALNRSQALDKRITLAATDVGGPQYADILALATRQAYCGIEITIGRNFDGSVNASDVMAFYKDTGIYDSGNGTAQVSPVDGLLSAFPAFLYLDPALCGALLEPLLRFQDSDFYASAYAALNVGVQYPLAVASADSHSQGIETSSGMIIMAYGHAKATGDYGIIGRYFSLLETWANFLTSNALSASNQTSATGVALSSPANLALQGIIAVQAMSCICALLNDSTTRHTYSSQANTLYSQWSRKALASDGHLRFSYDDTDSSFSLGYNMFWDLALGTGLLNTSVIDAQTRYIAKELTAFGAPTDSTNVSAASANWNMMAAAIATRDNRTRQALIDAIHKFAALQPSKAVLGQFPLMYTAQNGTVITGRSSPRQGAVYAPLLVSVSSSYTHPVHDTPPVSRGTSHGKELVGTIVGVTLGAIAGLSIVAGAGLLFLGRRRRRYYSTRKTGLTNQLVMLRSRESPPALLHASITPFQEVDGSPLPAELASPPDALLPEPRSKRAIRMRQGRQRNEEAVRADVEQGRIVGPTVTPAVAPGDGVHTQRMGREIANLWRAIAAIRTNEGDVDPPGYDG